MSTVTGDAAACRRLWASVLLTVFNDSWAATRKAKGDAQKIAAVREKALRYFRSRDGREVAMLAGVTAAPERMADMAVNLDAEKLTVNQPSTEAQE